MPGFQVLILAMLGIVACTVFAGIGIITLLLLQPSRPAAVVSIPSPEATFTPIPMNTPTPTSTPTLPPTETPTPTTLPTSTSTLVNTLEPQDTPSPKPTTALQPARFSIGQKVFVIPTIDSRSGFLNITVRSDTIFLFLKASDCQDIQMSSEEVNRTYYGQQANIIDIISCTDTNYYLIEVEEVNFLFKGWRGWVSENQISNEPISPVGLSFHLDFSETTDFSTDITAPLYLPSNLIRVQGEEAKTIFEGQPARLFLDSVRTTSGDGRDFTTRFVAINDGSRRFSFFTGDVFEGINDSGYRLKRGGKVYQEKPASVSVEPGQKATFEIGWSTRFPRTVFIVVNSSITENGDVTVSGDSAFFMIHPSQNN